MTLPQPPPRGHRALAFIDGGRGGTGWGEQEFGALQKRAASRLHRFYVPQQLGPAPEPPSLDTLLAALPRPAASHSANPAAASPGVAAAASGPSAGADAGCATVVLEGEEARHASRSLRLQPGDRVELCDGRGNLAVGCVTGSDKQRVWVSTDGPAQHVPWRGARWVVAVACTTLKGGRSEWLVEKLTELGAYMMVPLVTERSQAGGKAKFRIRGKASAAAGVDAESDSDGDYQPGRLERVAIAATKQSLRPHALHLAPPTSLCDVLPLLRRISDGQRNGGGGGDVGQRSAARAVPMETREGAGDGGVGPGEAGPEGESVRRGGHGGEEAEARAAAAGGSAAGANGAGCDGVGGGGSFALVAVAGAPPLATVLRQLRGSPRGAPAGPQPSEHARPGAPTQAGKHEEKVVQGHRRGAGSDESPVRVVLIGPEGDFTPAELAALVEAGARPVGLGANRLRTETAAVGLLAACLLTGDEGADPRI